MTSVCHTSAPAVVTVEHDDLGMVVVELRDEQVDLRSAEAGGEGPVRVGLEVLVGEEQHQVVDQRLLDRREVVVGAAREVDAAHLRASTPPTGVISRSTVVFAPRGHQVHLTRLHTRAAFCHTIRSRSRRGRSPSCSSMTASDFGQVDTGVGSRSTTSGSRRRERAGR